MTMLPLKAHVKNGRLVLDEPTVLPEGDVVYLQLADSEMSARMPVRITVSSHTALMGATAHAVAPTASMIKVLRRRRANFTDGLRYSASCPVGR